MSILNPMTKSEIRFHFTHYGWLLFCPVYVNAKGDDIQERNWVPEWLLWVAIAIQGSMAWLLSRLDVGYEPNWMLYITTPIKGRAA